MPRRVTLRVQSPLPLGDVTMVPAMLSGQPEAAMARAMAAALADVEAPTAAEVYRRLRQSFPLAPLSARVAALGVSWSACGAPSDLPESKSRTLVPANAGTQRI
jgi:hypothetical protein